MDLAARGRGDTVSVPPDLKAGGAGAEGFDEGGGLQKNEVCGVPGGDAICIESHDLGGTCGDTVKGLIHAGFGG